MQQFLSTSQEIKQFKYVFWHVEEQKIIFSTETKNPVLCVDVKAG